MVRCEYIELPLSPEQVFAAWPEGRPLAALLSGRTAPPHSRAGPCEHSRWSILAAPTECAPILPSEPGDPLDRFRSLIGPKGSMREGARPAPVPFVGGWIGSISYELGRVLEPQAQHVGARARNGQDHAPLMEWHHCPGALVHDAAEGLWWAVGDTGELPSVELLARRAGARTQEAGGVHLGELTSATGRAGFQEQVACVIELIHRGDVFQVNLAHRLRASFRGRPRQLYRRLYREAQPWLGAYLESPGRGAVRGGVRGCILSLSPERFLAFDPVTGRVVTRPMKGTRGAASPASDLRTSPKDTAELNMIVDLMRNDLGRVCDFGSVRVDEPRVIERHGDAPESGLWQGVATVSGTVREGLDLADVLRATFPPGSVTGAPKIRAMQIIDELEPVARGPYCGAIGYVSNCGRAALNVAIRTAILHSRTPDGTDDASWLLDYSVGAGIVADSRPDLEWRETLAKAGTLLGGGLARLAEGGR